MTEIEKLTVRRLGARDMKLVCSEEQIKQIVTPFVNLTAYGLSEYDSKKTLAMLDSVKSAKVCLAGLMTDKFGKTIEPSELNSIVVQVFGYDGYFKLSVTHCTADTVAQYNFTIASENKLPLVSMLLALAKAENPDADDEAHVKFAAQAIKNL